MMKSLRPIISLNKRFSLKFESIDRTDHFDLRRGATFRGIRKRARIGCISHRAKCFQQTKQHRLIKRLLVSHRSNARGCPSAISMAVIPRDQMSLLKQRICFISLNRSS